jgi:nitrous oxide reductase
MNRLIFTGAVSVLGVSLAVTACGGRTSSAKQQERSADAFVQQITVQFSRGQSGRLWDALVPSDQRVVSRAHFVACQADTGWNLKSLKVLDTYGDSVAVGGKTIPAEAVSVRATSDDGITTATMHAVLVNGTWHWLLQPADRQSYAAGACPRQG